MLINNLKKYAYQILMLLVVAYCIKEAFGNGDFKVFLEAAKLVSEGENPYNKWILVSQDNYCLYFYSPLWAVLLIPFTYLPNFIPNILWLLANLFFLYRTFQLLKDFIDLKSISSKQLLWILIICILMSIRFLLYNFGMIQMTIFLLWGTLESLSLIEKRKILLGGMLLALVINIKILPIVILPYLLYRKHTKGFITTIVFSSVFLMLPSLFTGWSANNLLLTEWWSVINPANPEHVLETGLGPHSLTALIPTLLTETSGELEMSRNIANLSESTAIYVLNLIRLSLIILSFFFLKWPPFKEARNKLFQLRELAFIILLIPLIFPRQQKYAFALIIPTLFYLSYFIVINYNRHKTVMSRFRWYSLITIIGLSFILMTLSTDGLIGRELFKICKHYKTITWGAILLIFALLLAQPKILLDRTGLVKEE